MNIKKFSPDEDDSDHLEQPPVLCSEPAWSETFATGQLPEKLLTAYKLTCLRCFYVLVLKVGITLLRHKPLCKEQWTLSCVYDGEAVEGLQGRRRALIPFSPLSPTLIHPLPLLPHNQDEGREGQGLGDEHRE